jgi:hypothetical protein
MLSTLTPRTLEFRRAGLVRPGVAGLPLLAALSWAAPAHAQAPQTPASAETEAASAEPDLPRIGLAPGEPQVRSAPTSVPFGVPPATSSEFVLDFHGYLLLPLNIGVHEREAPFPGQSRTVLHTPPLIPQNLRTFAYTGVVPEPWVQLNFTYGNSTVAGTVILAARSLTDATGLFNPVEQLGANDAYVSFNLTKPIGTPFEVKVGAMTGRYGIMGAHDQGRYGTPLIARTNSIGETVTAGFKLSQTTFVLEQGFGGQLGRPPRGLVPAGWNDFADPNVGASFVTHAHAGVAHAGLVQLGLHYFAAWSQDDQVSLAVAPDGRMTVMGADARLTAGRFGHLYVGAARVDAQNSSTVSGVIEILNARGGPELKREYLGPDGDGDGTLTIFGAQYDLSIARLLFEPQFVGKSPDVLLSLFTVGARVESDQPAFDDVLKLKGGAEVTYTPLSWFGVSGRFDHVAQDLGNSRRSFSIISPRVLFHTGWQSRDEIALQYSRFIYGGDVVVRRGFPPVDDPTAIPDRDVLSLSGTFWW